ncbi:carbamate kinase [Lacrimispora algidixylanolytica]|uniref:Carbamate kinase n=1 Tax=Lacrimispora algidixylanolytica TaxID=94868 RepID=A0A419TCP6_9FIRM|nr:carbamate kinase [Lacrimispora algidixylanolytica]RKD35238.1 carbamate kinase [Lacrimispora algidixylanolytica]
MKRIVIALGGNALGNTSDEQLERVRITAEAVVDIVKEGYEVIVCHGNGPQVGMINLAFEKGHEAGLVPEMHLPECTAMSQGYIGYHLQQAIDQALVKNSINDTVVITMLTQVIVDPQDPAFQNPTKPIGGYYSEEEANRLMAETGQKYVEDSGRGYRRVVPSPQPVSIYERISLNTLINANHVVIAGGGGGIPVVKEADGSYHGVAAVVDKDLAAEKIAELVDADAFVILTAVDRVSLHFGKPDQKDLDQITLKEAEQYVKEGHFAAGSMLPKVKAAMKFIENKEEGISVICSLEKVSEALSGNTGTRIIRK